AAEGAVVARHPGHHHHGARPHGRRPRPPQLRGGNGAAQGFLHSRPARRPDTPARSRARAGQIRPGSRVVIRILYVEDNDDNVYMLKMRLELVEEFEVLVAPDGEIGCEMAEAGKPDLILLDLELPVVDGWEAARRLKGNSLTRHIPIIALTAHALAG